jgi:hypothetical protein
LDLKKIFNLSTEQNYQVIYNSFNIEYKILKEFNLDFNSKFKELKDCEFILHVGSSLPRKNRDILVKLLKLITTIKKIFNNNMHTYFTNKVEVFSSLDLTKKISKNQNIFSYTYT